MGGKTYDNTPDTPPVLPPPAAPDAIEEYAAIQLKSLRESVGRVQEKLAGITNPVKQLRANNVIAAKLKIDELMALITEEN